MIDDLPEGQTQYDNEMPLFKVKDPRTGLERALVPSGYLCLHEGGYNQEETPFFSPVYISGLGPCNLTRCWPIYNLAAVFDAVALVRSNVKVSSSPPTKLETER